MEQPSRKDAMVGGPQNPSGNGSKEHDKQNHFVKTEIKYNIAKPLQNY